MLSAYFRDWVIIQVVEHLPSKLKTLSSNLTTITKKKNFKNIFQNKGKIKTYRKTKSDFFFDGTGV
jgi:hypothetical protein